MSVVYQIAAIAGGSTMAGLASITAYKGFSDNHAKKGVAGLILTSLWGGLALANGIDLKNRVDNALDITAQAAYEIGQEHRNLGVDFYSLPAETKDKICHETQKTHCVGPVPLIHFR